MSEYQELDQIRHMLQHPERDLGDTTIHVVSRYLLDVNSMSLQRCDIPYNTAVERLFQEILYNAVDNAERSRIEGIDPGCIKVWMSKDTIRIRNEGKPISCTLQPGKDIHKPEFIFSNLLTGSNFGGASRKVQTVGGRFGIGGKATNIFSSYFNIDIGNANEGTRYRQTWRNNMYVDYRPCDGDSVDTRMEKSIQYRQKVQPIIESYTGTSYTQITFIVDFARFYDDDIQYGFSGKREYTPEMLLAYATHCADASMTGNLPVYFNDKLIDCSGNVLKYASLYFPSIPTHAVFHTNDSTCVVLDTPDNGITISFVNGVINEEGGVHVDTWRKVLFRPIISHMKSKMKGYKINDKMISAHISMILFCRLPNPRYKSQTKDKVTSPKPVVGADNVIDRVLEWTAVSRMESIAKAQINLIGKKTDGDKKKMVKSDKLMDAAYAGDPRESDKCTLIITEGDGAANFAIKGIDNGGYMGALPIKGKLLNVGNCDEYQYAANTEIAEMKKALGLREGSDYSTVEGRRQLRYGRLIIMSDQDRDGSHIRMLVINFFRHKFPSLLCPTTCGTIPSFVSIMETPYMRVRDGTNVIPFFYEKEYDDWINDSTVDDAERQRRQRCDVKYFKGLGSSSDMELMEAFNIGKIMTPVWDHKAEDLMSIAFDKGYEDDRKEWLMSWDPVKKVGAYSTQFNPDTISHLVTNQLCEFSWVNVSRSTPSIVDGLKECQRKIITVVLGMAKEKKVSQLKGLVSDQMHYRYGDEALYRTIVGMGNYCVGTNNIPLIKAKGQYDSRIGKNAAPDRYIYAARSTILKYLFRKEDTCILEYQYDGKEKIEPKYYYPILPMWAINGSRGIGTGFSTDIPAHNPIDVMKYIGWWLKRRTSSSIVSTHPPELVPWYRNYQGQIVKMGNNYYSIGSYEEIPSRKRIKDIHIKEIPVTQTIETYINKLKKLCDKPIMNSTNWTDKGKCPTWITGFKPIPRRMTYKYKGESYIEVLPSILIEGAVCITASNTSPLRALGLIEKISDTNITLLDDMCKPRQYGGTKTYTVCSDGSSYISTGTMNALDHYCDIRFNAYEKRRTTMMSLWKKEIDKLLLQRQFINDVVNNIIQIRDGNRIRKKALLVQDITSRGYPAEFGDISIYSLTEDGIDKVNAEIDSFNRKYESYRDTTPAQLWLSELEELYKHL